MSRFLPLFLDCRNGPSRFLSDYYYLLFIDFGADASRPCAPRPPPPPSGASTASTCRTPVDDDTSKHNLTLDGYGADDRWVLLEPIA